ncbi:MAG: hypothetical protein LBH04_01305 [Tannerellaceae bacterium]|nr:hypothetical protein [Tannerellaceae bacterium]
MLEHVREMSAPVPTLPAPVTILSAPVTTLPAPVTTLPELAPRERFAEFFVNPVRRG